MSFRWILRLGWWIAVLALVIYGGITSVAAYFRAADAVESAIDTTTRWDRAQKAAPGTTPLYTDSIRDEILAKARKLDVPLDPAKLKVAQSGRTISVDMRWAQPIITISDETVVAFPLSLSRSFNLQ